MNAEESKDSKTPRSTQPSMSRDASLSDLKTRSCLILELTAEEEEEEAVSQECREDDLSSRAVVNESGSLITRMVVDPLLKQRSKEILELTGPEDPPATSTEQRSIAASQENQGRPASSGNGKHAPSERSNTNALEETRLEILPLRPGAFPVGGEKDQDDGTIVIGSSGESIVATTIDSSSAHSPKQKDNGLFGEPLPASLVEEETQKNNEPKLRYKTIACVFLFLLAAAGITLGVGIPRLLDDISNNDDNSTEETPQEAAPVVLTKWAEFGQPEEERIVGRVQGDWLGSFVSISGDGTTVAVGAPFSAERPYIQIFRLQDNFTQYKQIEAPAPNTFLGLGLSLSRDGSALSFGSLMDVAVSQYKNGEWEGHESTGFGFPLAASTSISADGFTVAMADGRRAQVCRYDSETGTWSILGQLLTDNPEYHFATSLSLSANGDRLAVGIPGSDAQGDSTGSIRVYDFNGTEWVPIGDDINGMGAFDAFGTSVSISGDGNCVAGGASQNFDFSTADSTGSRRPGYCRAFCLEEGDWVLRGETIGGLSGSWFGYSTDLSFDGRTLIVGAPYANARAGQVSMFRFDDGLDHWTQVARFDGNQDEARCGISVALSWDGDFAVAGCPWTEMNGLNETGAVRVYHEISCNDEDIAPDNLTPCRQQGRL